ncbi:MAG: ABC transporter permease [Eubacteriales bacterium]|nr:ABC transporter permease [Eubacteriales bacterium]
MNNNHILIQILAATLATSPPILYASLGEIFSERAGILNLGLEGIMLIGAVSGFMVGLSSESLFLAILATLAAGAIVGLVYAFLTVTLQANQTVAGLALVTVGSGLSGVLGRDVTGAAATVSFSNVAIPGLSKIPVIGPILFNQNPMVYALYILVPLAHFYIFKTRPGLKLRALGENPSALDASGTRVYLLRYLYVILGCSISALGGAYITLAYTPTWMIGITAGKGWIAAALVIFASWKPINAALGALLFGGIEVLGTRMQTMGVPISSYFINMLPYIFTVLVLIISTGDFRKSKSPVPAALGQPYDRESR